MRARIIKPQHRVDVAIRLLGEDFLADSVRVKHQSDETALLPLDQATRFQVYEPRTIALAAGDLIRITQNGFTKTKQRLNNGDLKKVEGFTKDVDLKLANGWVVSKDFGHWTHGYCLTSYSSQSKSVDCVFIAESAESFRAAGREQFYVSVSRFKQAMTIYTDDKQELLRAVSKTSQRPSATDLVTKQSRETTHPGDSPKRVAQRQSVEKNVDQSQSESQARRREAVPVRRRHPVDRHVRQSYSKGITR